MRKLLWLAAAGLCVLSACQSNVATRRGELLVLDVPEDRKDNPEDIERMFKMRNYVILETTDSSVFGRPDEIVQHKGDFYILDSRNGAVLRFGADGKFIRKYAHKGKGPGEYMWPQDIAINGDTLWILDGMGQMHGYSLDDEYLATRKTPSARAFKILDSGIAFHTASEKVNGVYSRYTYIDNDGDTIQRAPFCEHIRSHGFSFGRGSVIFSDCGGMDVLAAFPLNDTLYAIDKSNGHISPLAVINFGMDRTVPLDAEKEEAKSILDGDVPKTIFSVHNWGDVLMFEYSPKKASGFTTVLVDLPSGEILYEGNGSIGKDGVIWYPFVYSSDSKDHPMMTLLNSDYLVIQAEYSSREDNPLLHEIVDQLDEEANPVLVFYDFIGPQN